MIALTRFHSRPVSLELEAVDVCRSEAALLLQTGFRPLERETLPEPSNQKMEGRCWIWRMFCITATPARTPVFIDPMGAV